MKRAACYVLCIMMLLMNITCMASAEDAARLVLIDTINFGYTYSDRMQTAISAFHEQYPEVQIEVEEYSGDNWEESLITELMAGKIQIDILPTYDDAYYAYLNHRLLTDLFQYPGFDRVVDDWIDISPLFIEDHSLYSVPMVFLETRYSWNEALGKKLDIRMPEKNWTWADFKTLLFAFNEKRDALGMNDVYLFAESGEVSPIILWHYTCAYRKALMEGEKTYDDPELRELLSLWKSAADDGLFYMYSLMTDVDYTKVLIQDADFAGGGMDVPHVAFPQMGERSSPFVVLGLGVYEGSEHKEAAAELLRIYASRENIVSGFPTEGIYLKDVLYWNDSDYDSALHYPAAYAQYLRDMLNHSVRSYVESSLESSIKRLWPQFLNGSITEDEIVAALDEAAQRSINE